MSLIDFVIGKQNLQGLAPAQQDQAREEARRQFIVNSLLGGKGLASGYAAAQQVVPGIQAAQQRQRMEQARQQSMVPTGQFTNQPRSGSQLDLIRQQMGGDTGLASLLDDRAADSLTSQSLIRGGQGTGLGGSGLSAQQQLVPETRLDPTRFAELASQVLPASDVQGILKNFETVRPKINDQGVMTDIQGNVIGSIPTFKDGVQTRFDRKQDSFVSGAVPGYQGAVIQNYVPQLGQGMGFARDAAGNVTTQLAPGYAEALAATGTIGSLAEAQGRGQTVVQGGVTGVIPMSNIVGTPQQFIQNLQGQQPSPQGTLSSPIGQPTASGAGAPRTGAPSGGFVQTELTEDQKIRSATTGKIFTATADKILERAESAGNRIFNAQEVFNLADTLDPNKLTDWIGAAAPFLRILPGIGDNLDKFSTNFALFNQQYNRAVQTEMSGPAAVGNLNAQEVDLFKGSTFKTADPKTSTKWISAVEIARAEKDLARQEFLSDYLSQGGEPAQFSNAWSRSPLNVRIYDHPMVDQFITGQVRDALVKPRRPNQAVEFNLPPGYKADEVDLATEEIIVTKPDGTKFRVR